MTTFKLRRTMRMRDVLICASFALTACGPRARIPPRPVEPIPLQGALAPDDPAARIARSLAPILFLQRDEWFPLERVVAVVHPTARVIAYHLLWRDDVHGSWIPFTVPTDQEVVWVGYDSTGAPTDLWTYWHRVILHTPWGNRGPALVNIQWGKHGSLPRGLIERDLPASAKLNGFYLFTWLGLPDIWLGRLTRRGPMCFCHGYDRYREFTRPLHLADRIDVVSQLADPSPVLAAVFGRPFSRKIPWPLGLEP
ncbi:MAG: hypothetical protein WD801_13360 [Gemmatimonadaceae bacterium]